MKKVILTILVLILLATSILAANTTNPDVIKDPAKAIKDKIEDKADSKDGCGDGSCKNEYNFLFKNYCLGISDPYSNAKNTGGLFGGANGQFNQMMPSIGSGFQYQQYNPMGMGGLGPNTNYVPGQFPGSGSQGFFNMPTYQTTQANSGLPGTATSVSPRTGFAAFFLKKDNSLLTTRFGKATLLLSLAGKVDAINPRQGTVATYSGATSPAIYQNGYTGGFNNPLANSYQNTGGRYNQFAIGGSPFGTTGMGYGQGGQNGPIDSTQSAMQAMLCGNTEALYGHTMYWLQQMKQVEKCYEYVLQQEKVSQEALMQCKVGEAQVHCAMSQMLFLGQGYGMSNNVANQFGGNTFGNIGQVYNIWSDDSLLDASSGNFGQGSPMVDNCVDAYIRDIEIPDVASPKPSDVRTLDLNEDPTIRNFEITREDLGTKEKFTVTGEIEPGSSNVTYTVFLKCRSSSRTILPSKTLSPGEGGSIIPVTSEQEKYQGCSSGAVKFTYEAGGVKREKIKVINFE